MLTQSPSTKDSVLLFYAPPVDASDSAPSDTASATACHYLFHAAEFAPLQNDALRQFWSFEPDSLDWIYFYNQRAVHCWKTLNAFYKPSAKDAFLSVSLNPRLDTLVETFLQRVKASVVFPEIDTFAGPTTSDRLEVDLIAGLEPIPQVHAIYATQFPDELRFLVILDMPTYNLELIDTLGDIEFSLHARYPTTLMSFSYRPRHDEAQASLPTETHRLLWERSRSHADAAIA